MANQNGWLIQVSESAHYCIRIFARAGVRVFQWQIHGYRLVASTVQSCYHLVPHPGILTRAVDQGENAHAVFETSAPE